MNAIVDEASPEHSEGVVCFCLVIQVAAFSKGNCFRSLVPSCLPFPQSFRLMFFLPFWQRFRCRLDVLPPICSSARRTEYRLKSPVVRERSFQQFPSYFRSLYERMVNKGRSQSSWLLTRQLHGQNYEYKYNQWLSFHFLTIFYVSISEEYT